MNITTDAENTVIITEEESAQVNEQARHGFGYLYIIFCSTGENEFILIFNQWFKVCLLNTFRLNPDMHVLGLRYFQQYGTDLISNVMEKTRNGTLLRLQGRKKLRWEKEKREAEFRLFFRLRDPLSFDH